MVEYSLILATVVIAFAVAGQLGLSSAFVQRLNDSQENYQVLLPDSVSDLAPDKIDKINTELTLH